MPTYVPGSGNASAKLLILGEAPGKTEEERLEAFVGPTGQIVSDFIHKSGLSMSECYKTNVVKYRPPGNDINKLSQLGMTVEQFYPELDNEIKSINPNCILALGETALNAITGLRGIKKWRGSLLSHSRMANYKLVSTIHPASILHGESEQGGMMSWKDLAYIQLDINRAVEQSAFAELRLPSRNLWVARNSGQLWNFLERHSNKEWASVDIETFKTYPMCIGIAFDKVEACCIPLFPIVGREGKEIKLMGSDRNEAWKLIADFLAGPIKKIGQNFKFDHERLEQRLRMKVNNFAFDIMLAWHCLYPELYKSLAFQQSLVTLEPFHKDEGAEFNPKKDDPERFLLYCAKDAVVTFEIAMDHMESMKGIKLW